MPTPAQIKKAEREAAKLGAKNTPVATPVIAASETTAPALNPEDIVGNYTVAEFKELMGITTFEVLKHKTKGTRFMASQGGSIGTVARKIDLSKALQVIELVGEEGDPVYILCNRGEGNYEVEATL